MANKQIKKQKKKGNPELRAKVLRGLSTLIKNDAVVDVGRNWKWYLPVVMAILAIIIAVIPILTQNMSVQARNSFFGTSYGYETGLVHFQEEIDSKNVSLVISDKKLTNPGDSWTAQIKNENSEPWYTYKATGSNEVIFEVFYNYAESISDTDFLKRITENKNPFTEAVRSLKDDGSAKPYITAFLFLGKESFYCSSRKLDGSQGSSVSGLYDHHDGFDLKSLAKNKISGEAIPAEKFGTREYLSILTASWTTFVNDGYASTKVKRAWSMTGIVAGIDAGGIIIMGLLLFLLTRGKRNPYRIFTFWQTQKMSYTASFTPAILGMILGFIMAQFASFSFLIVFAFRIMWMSMRTLSPSAGQQQ